MRQCVCVPLSQVPKEILLILKGRKSCFILYATWIYVIFFLKVDLKHDDCDVAGTY